MKSDPRTKEFYKLQKKANPAIGNLTDAERRTYLGYIEKMIAFVPEKKARKSWIELQKEVDSFSK